MRFTLWIGTVVIRYFPSPKMYSPGKQTTYRVLKVDCELYGELLDPELLIKIVG